MRYLILLFVVTSGFAVLASSCFMQNDEKPYFKEIDRIVAKVIRNTTTQFGVEPMAEGLSIPGGEFKGVYIFFQNKGELSKDRIEKILLSTGYDILERLNSNEVIRPQMVAYPFTLKQLDLNIAFFSENGEEVYAPKVFAAVLNKGQFYLRTIDKETYKHITLDAYPASESKYYRGEK